MQIDFEVLKRQKSEPVPRSRGVVKHRGQPLSAQVQSALIKTVVLVVSLDLLTGCVAGPEWGQDSYDSTETNAPSFVIDNETSSSVMGLDIASVWWTSNSTPGYRGASYAVAPTAADNSKPARFWFKLTQGGCYNVAARWTSGANRSTAVLFRAQNEGGAAVGEVQVDQSKNGGRWNKLGQWSFSAGRGSVAIARKGPADRFVVADAIRLTRCGAPPIEDGPQGPSSNTNPNANSVELAVPFFYQYNNVYEGTATCGITSAAMAINYWLPNNVTPDKVYVEYGKSIGQSPEGIASLAKSRGLKSVYTRGGTREQIRKHLRAGRPVVVHGFWTGPGHIAVIVGFNSSGWIVNDPAGDWEVCYGCGGGKGVRYNYGGGWDNKLSHDGDIWFSTMDKNAI